MQTQFGHRYVLVTADGLEIKDSPGTRGQLAGDSAMPMISCTCTEIIIILNVLHVYFITIGGHFWKQAARKFYAVPEGDFHSAHRRSRKRKPYIILDDEDEDTTDFEPVMKKAAMNGCNSCCVKLDVIEGKIEVVNKNLDKVLSLSPSMSVPPGLKLLLQDSFSCPICKLLMTPPVIFAKCCRRVIGCEKCTNEWYSGTNATTKPCPYCRGERGCAETVRICGLDEFLVGIKTLFSSGE